MTRLESLVWRGFRVSTGQPHNLHGCPTGKKAPVLTERHLHGVSRPYVLAGCLYHRLAGLVQRAVNAIIGTRVRFLNQGLKLEERNCG